MKKHIIILFGGKFSLRFVLFCLSLLFLLNCSTGPAFEDLSGSTQTEFPYTLMHSSFGGWRGTSASEHFVLTALDSNSMVASDVGGDAFNLSPESAFSAYLH